MRIFILCDDTGDEVVDALKFITAASILVVGTIEQKFSTALSFRDYAGSGKVSADDTLAAVQGTCVLLHALYCLLLFTDLMLFVEEIYILKLRIFCLIFFAASNELLCGMVWR